MDIPAAAHQAASDHLFSTAKSNTGWLSDLRVLDIDTSNGTITSGSIGGTIDVLQAVGEVLAVAVPAIRSAVAAELREMFSPHTLEQESLLEEIAAHLTNPTSQPPQGLSLPTRERIAETLAETYWPEVGTVSRSDLHAADAILD